MGSVPAWAAIFVSGVFSLLSYLSARESKSQKKQAEDEKKAAKLQADRAEEGANAALEAQRAAVAAQDQIAKAIGDMTALTAKQIEDEERKPWRFEPRIGSDKTFLLNTTATPKYGVRVEGPAVRQPTVGFVDGLGNKELDTLRRIWSASLSVTVKWHRLEDCSDAELQQHGELPRDP